MTFRMLFWHIEDRSNMAEMGSVTLKADSFDGKDFKLEITDIGWIPGSEFKTLLSILF